MTVDWTLVAPAVAMIAGVRHFLRSRRQYHAGEIERGQHLIGVGGAIGMIWGSIYFGIGHQWMAGMFIVMLLPEVLIPERHYARFEAWFMHRLMSKKGRQRYEQFREAQARERAAELEFEERMKLPEPRPGSPQGNDP